MHQATRGHTDTVRASIDAFNRGDAAGYAGHYAPEAKLFGPFFPEPIVGREAIEETTAAMSDAFPGMRWTITSLLEDGDRVACELHIEGIHGGPLPTPAGVLEPTGRPVSFDVLEILEFDADGLVREHREYMDPSVVMAQLGV